MNCSNCGMSNDPNSRFCIKCGNALNPIQNNNTNLSATPNSVPNGLDNNMNQTTPIQSNDIYQNNTVIQTPQPIQQTNYQQVQSQQPPVNNVEQTAKITFMNYFFIILAVILKPFTSIKEELNKFNSFKNSAVLSIILAVSATIIKLLTTMFSVVRVKSYSWSKGGSETTWVWENLKKIEYFKVIGKDLLIFLGIILAIAVVYYIASLIAKKQVSFSRLLGISAFAVTPIIVCSLILSPLLSLIYAQLGMIVTVIGAIYTFIIIYEGMNSEILISGNAKYYFNLVCLSILGISAYYLYMKLMMSSVAGGLENILDMFG